MNLFYNGEANNVEFDVYSDGSIKVLLRGRYSGKVIEASVFGEDFVLKKDEVLIKNYSELQGIEEALIFGKVICVKPVEIFDFGYTNLKVFKLTGRALEKISYNSIISKNSSRHPKVS